MATQSSTAVMVRALVMLVCLVVIPLAAVFGKSLPEMLKLFELRRPQGPASADASGGGNSQFAPMGGSHPSIDDYESRVDPLYQQNALPDVNTWPEAAADTSRSTVTAAHYESPAAGIDPFTQIRGRLRELGVTRWSLESWGNQQQLYRFRCEMAVAGGGNYAEHFEASDAEPLQAMALVLQQVQDRRAGRR